MLVTGYAQLYMYFHAVFFTTQFMICQYENYILIHTLSKPTDNGQCHHQCDNWGHPTPQCNVTEESHTYINFVELCIKCTN